MARNRRGPQAPLAPLSDLPLPELDPDSPTWPQHTVWANGVELAVRHTPAATPDAEPALLVHGLGGSAINWTDFATLLAPRIDVEAIDLPGHGSSGPAPDRDYSQRALADTVIAYLDRSARGPVHLVGNSMGGALSIRVAAERPDLVRTLTLISPAVPDVRLRVHPLRSDPRMALLVVPVLGEVVLRRMGRVAVDTRMKGTIAVCFADPERYSPTRFQQDVEQGLQRLKMPWANEAFLRSTRGLVRSQFLRRREVWAELRAISAPTLVLWGDTDRLVSADLADVVAGYLPGARVRVFENIGHTAMMEDPISTARAFFGLLDADAERPAS